MKQQLLSVKALPAETQWRRTQGIGFARTLQTVPLVALELTNVVLSLPVAIVPAGAAGWRVVAVLGAALGSNACVGPQGQWLSRHVPAALRGHPFVWQTDEAGGHEVGVTGELALLAEARVADPSPVPGLEPLWTEDGRLSPQVVRVQSFFAASGAGGAGAVCGRRAVARRWGAGTVGAGRRGDAARRTLAPRE